MIWLIIGNYSYQIISSNVFQSGDNHQVWVTKADGKNLKIMETKNEADAKELKDAIDFAIEMKEPTFKMAV